MPTTSKTKPNSKTSAKTKTRSTHTDTGTKKTIERVAKQIGAKSAIASRYADRDMTWNAALDALVHEHEKDVMGTSIADTAKRLRR